MRSQQTLQQTWLWILCGSGFVLACALAVPLQCALWHPYSGLANLLLKYCCGPVTRAILERRARMIQGGAVRTYDIPMAVPADMSEMPVQGVPVAPVFHLSSASPASQTIVAGAALV